MDHTTEPSSLTERIPPDSDHLIVADDEHSASVAGDAHISSSSHPLADEKAFSSSSSFSSDDTALSTSDASAVATVSAQAASTSNDPKPEYELRYYCTYCPKYCNYTEKERLRHCLEFHRDKIIGACSYCATIHFKVKELQSHEERCRWRALMIMDTSRYWNKVNLSMKLKLKRDKGAYRRLKDQARDFCDVWGTSGPPASKRSRPKSCGDDSWRKKRFCDSDEMATPDDEPFSSDAESDNEDL